MTTIKRKTATKPAHVKPLTSAKWSGVQLSNKTKQALGEAYNRRKKKASASKRFHVEDMKHFAEVGMRFVKRDSTKIYAENLPKVSIEVGRHTGYYSYLFLRYDIRYGPKGYVSLEMPKANGITETGKALMPGYFYITAWEKYRGKTRTLVEGAYNDPAVVGIIAADVLRMILKTEAGRTKNKKS